jgi:probable HAF family extracellular repeat protein
MSSSLRIVVAAVAATLSYAASAAPHYSYLDLGRVIGVDEINGNGDVIGRLTTGREALYKASKGQWEVVGDKNNYALESLNNRDLIVGERNYGSRGRPHAVAFKPSGAIVDMLTARESYATVVRADGTAYGVAEPFGGGATFPFVWRHGDATPLPRLAGHAWTMPVGATKSGLIAANGQDDPRSPSCPIQPAVYDGGAWHPLDGLGGSCAEAHGMNDLGDVAGWSLRSGDQPGHAVVWHDGVAMDLGTLGGWGSTAADINTLGQVTGTDFDAEGNAWAFLYADGVMTWLDDLVDDKPAGWTFFEAVSINASGQILVYGDTGTSVNAFVLTPKP